MKTLAERLAYSLNLSGKTPAELARATGKTESAVSQWLSGETKSMRSDSLMAACNLLSLNPQWLVTGKGERSTQQGGATKQPDPALERRHNYHTIPSLEDACNTLARYFEGMSEEDRDNAVRWLAGLVHRPSSAPHVIGALMEMVVNPRKSPPEKSTGT